MAKPNASNARIKRDYFRYLRDARGRDEATIDAVAKALARFEETAGAKDFRRFHREQAMAFKRRLANAHGQRSGEKLSKATVHSTLRHLKAFFEWLSREPGFRRHIAWADADYFNLSEKDAAIARARREKKVPTLEQVRHVLVSMPAATVLDRRDRALIAFAAITAARVGALASLQLRHVDLAGGFVDQDARVVQTKFGKTFRTYFMPTITEALPIVTGWIEELARDHFWGAADPLFPATRMAIGENGGFVPAGLERRGWATSEPIRAIFRRAFAAAGLPYYNPHSFRDMLVHHAMKQPLTPEQMKAWSQNLGHADVLTTFTSYGTVPPHRQGELISGGADVRLTGGAPALDQAALMEAIAKLVENASIPALSAGG
ncbi:tyrosine-type recombinase/integrase [Rhizorhabdus wittichii]|uniref:Tyrosine-type recombinase/integrase n=1 Tax=Rhizorhabdus wittichii TaxID=160791 RepID=A0A975D5T3_9SPHN|nr:MULTISPECIES: tyrosine-type recombinase/integrase [Sphingomonadaceae]QTH23572.1 tyrosine-type recombinase/integrase [Rhizorhabdus wittichii]